MRRGWLRELLPTPGGQVPPGPCVMGDVAKNDKLRFKKALPRRPRVAACLAPGYRRPALGNHFRPVRSLKYERPSERHGSSEGRPDVRGRRLWRTGRGLPPRHRSWDPPPFSLGTAEVGRAYRTPERPVKAGKLFSRFVSWCYLPRIPSLGCRSMPEGSAPSARLSKRSCTHGPISRLVGSSRAPGAS